MVPILPLQEGFPDLIHYWVSGYILSPSPPPLQQVTFMPTTHNKTIKTGRNRNSMIKVLNRQVTSANYVVPIKFCGTNQIMWYHSTIL